MSIEEIENRIPHRSPMRLLDEIVSLDESRIVCRKTFGHDEYFVQGHFPGNPIVPGVIQCECCLQAGAALLYDLTPQQDDIIPVATRLDSVKFKRVVRPGDTVEIDVTLKDHVSTAFFMTGKVLVDGKIAARLDFACSVTKDDVTRDNAESSS
ncbi:MAG: beta-hydroxyacyl-ACP dehydratase [Pirellulales bacterium]|nr:beta-hydroxyacyl-ACP dehydratase [Pirellulales bacterium]